MLMRIKAVLTSTTTYETLTKIQSYTPEIALNLGVKIALGLVLIGILELGA